jgi:predicted O-linked N-acetylglucosamine transferase (SPINDLY family)
VSIHTPKSSMRRRRSAKPGKKIPVQPELSGSSIPDYAAMLQNAMMLHQRGRLDEAEALYREILCVEPDHFNALQLLAALVVQKKNALEAVVLFDHALSINPCHPESLNNRGNALRELHRPEEALASYDKAIALKPDYVDAYSNRGLALTELQRYDEALLSYDKAIALNADYAEPYYNRGNLLLALRRYDEALFCYERFLTLNPEDADVYNNRGLALTELKRYDEALLSYDRVLALHPCSVEAYSNRGNVFTALQRYDEALLSYDQALVFQPDYTRVYYNRGIVLTELKRFEEALASYEHAFAITPEYNFLFGKLLHTQMLMCDWSSFDTQVHQLVEKIERHEKASTPFELLAVADSLFVQKEAAEIFIQEKFPVDHSLPSIPRRTRGKKIRIGYYSADFYDHATAFLMAELFEQHDRERFELIAFSYGPDVHDSMRMRVAAAFDRFLDVRNQSDREVALLSRELEIDIAIDLKGFTGASRLGIFALRAAPIQVSYLGYPGTTGAEYLDYLIADRTLIPESSRYGYTEKIVSLPDSYQVNDAKRSISERVFTREELGLPECGFVFCCFNNNFKITPGIFAGWMRILKQVEGSVLWLLEDNPKAASNLRKEATERGVDADRLIFAKRLPLPEHLARHRSADLFLDTFPCNAHTTASDALWVGLPVLTLSGESFASRVAASLLNALHLPELITSRQEEYEALAIELARSPEKSGQIRRKLEQNRLTTPLFDTQRFTSHLEEAYRAMYERYQAGLSPEHMVLLPSAQGRSPLWIKDGNSPIPGDERHGAVASEAVVSLAVPHAFTLQAALERHQQGRLDEAEALYREIVCLQPDHVDALQLLATIAAQKKNFTEAVALFDQALAINPAHPLLLNNLGNALQAMKRYEEAIVHYDRALVLNPLYAEAHFNRGVVLKELNRHDEAIESYDKAIAANPGYAEAFYNRGNAMQELKRYEEAVLCYERALTFRPDDADLYFSLGIAFFKLKRYEEAVLSYDKSIALDPEGADAYNNRGVALKELKRYEEAVLSYDKVIALKPEYAEAYSNRGNVLTEMRRYGDALSSYEMALAMKPDDPVIYVNRGVTLQEMKRYEEAALSYGKALLIKPEYDFLYAERMNLLMRICDWSGFEQNLSQLFRKIERHEKAATPFPVLALLDSPALQKEVAMNYVQEKYPEQPLFPPIMRSDPHDRIRIGYYSADFHNHATAYLMAELFEQHDKRKFELFAFSFGNERRGGMRERLSAAFDHFFEVQNQSDREIVQRSRDLAIDIAVDLKGFTQDSRTGIFALRAAPIQVNYLGYPGTIGADYMDYLIADQILIPESSRQFYTEKIVSLPDSYQVNDAKRRIAERIFTREELGLPQRGFVFCCFNNNYKITPATFDGWMRILKQVPESVLWLFEDNPQAAKNLRKEAVQRGLDAERLVFATRRSPAEHLARHRLADLFLDTFPCNAHTTASDALWAGLPVLTLRGESFAARVAASLLHAIQLPELITTTQEAYEALAIMLATNPEMLLQIRRKLEQNRLTTSLFDTQRFTGHLEEAYRAIYERYQEGLLPEHIVLLPSVQGGKQSYIKSRQPSLPNGEYQGAVASETVVSPELCHAPSLQSALQLHQQGRLDEAEALYKEILCLQPENFDALRLMATIAAQRKEFSLAIALFDQAIRINPNHANSFNNQGVAYQELQRYDEALGCFEKALALKPDYAEAYTNYGNVLQELKRADAAFVHVDAGCACKSADALVYSNRGNEIQKSERYEEALCSYDKALALKPDYDEAHFNRAIALKKLKRYHESLLSYDRVLALKPDYAEAYSNRGNVLTVLGRCDEALLSYDRALALRPDYAMAYANRGVALQELKQYDEAILSYGHALALQPDYDFLFAECLFLKMRICQWSDFEQQVSHLCRKLERHEKVSTPFPVLALTDSLLLQKEAALIYVGAKHAHARPLETIAKRARHEKIRIGYYSADFHNHATSYLMAELFEMHDRRQFELFAFSFGPERHDGMKERITAAFDHFVDVRTQSDSDVVQLSRSLEIDIAVDLKGFTTDSRTGIFALRAAPIQVSYLGYPATTGLESLDYLIADAMLIPERSQKYYTEKIVYLPDSYQVNDGKRSISERVFTREELGLPETGFVFSCFNNNYKINPAVFDGWMRLLGHVEGSVLWLFEDNPQAAENLRKEALKRGIEPERLIFARRIPPQEHLARHRFADLFLDTFPCNAHTTASDALWAGLPLLTLAGESFAGRVAASLLHAMRLPELITASQEEYEALAIALATNPEKLGEIRHKLEQNRLTTPLFDTRLFTRNLEEAYRMMYERYQADLLPDHLVVKRGVPTQDAAHQLRSALLVHQQGRLDEAEALFHEIVQSYPEHFEALRFLAIIAVQKKRFEDSLFLFDHALKINPRHATTLNNQGVAFQKLHRFDEALCSYEHALAVKPDYAEAHLNRGVVLQELKRFEEALLNYDKAIAFKPDYAEAYSNRGAALQEQQRNEEALLSYERALLVRPDYAEASYNLGVVLQELKRYEEALESFERALALKPDYDYLFGMCLHLKMQMCDWSDFERQLSPLFRKIERSEKVSTPSFLSISDSLLLQKKVAMIYVGETCFSPQVPSIMSKRSRHEKIRIGYYSADFHDHATAYLMAELFELHDRSRFELFAFSFGPDRQDKMRKRVAAAFDHFFDVRTRSDAEIVLLSRELEIDIAIDLKGFTQGSRTGIFALRAAPIQVSYLGYPGTMGAGYIDYLIADKVLIPEGSRYGYTEKIAYLPDCYQVNDTKRRIAEQLFTREECGLPESGFVFACFNNNYKITPSTFDGWMRILGHVKGSVLWLFEDNVTAADNLRKEAIKRGVDAERLVFAKRMPIAEHLARHRLGDLFLDTLPYNAHTTASDALWAGLPLLTLAGESFAGRVAASLLHAMQLPELITASQEEYEALAIALATNPEKLGQIRHKLEQNRLTTPLFDTRLFTRNLEEAYRMMYERYQADLPPDHLVVKRAVSTEDIALQLRSALLMHQQGRLDEAEALYHEIVQSCPEHFDALRLLAIIAVQKKRFEDSLVLFDHALKINPRHATTLSNQGVAFQKLHRFDEALCSYEHALAVKPDYAEASLNRGVVLQELGRFGEALLSYESALAGNADNAPLWFYRGNVLQELKRYEEAVLSYDKAIALKPDYGEAHSNRGFVLKALRRFDESVLSYERALAINPDYAIAYANLGNVLQDLKRFGEAVLSYDKAIALKPDYTEAYSNRGVALQEQQRNEEALLSYKRALLVRPDYAEASYNLGVALQELKRYEEALESFERALALKPDYDFLSGMCLNTKMQMCDWSDFERQFSPLFRKIERSEKVSTPFSLLSISDSLLLQKKVAMIYVGETCFSPQVPSTMSKRSRHEKIRIGYYSADFHDHATAYLMAELFELHDRSRFELFAFSFGPDRQDKMRKRVSAAFDHFFDVRTRSDAEIVLLSRELEIDIAIDLKGFTQGSRTGIFALRTAPIQVSYLGYPGTLGAGYIDYLIADRVLIPEGSRYGYTEKIAYLPDCYQVNDTKRRIAEKLFTREECGLPESGFVFACFNNNYKITPSTFDGWMRILRQIEGSVLWLLEDNVTAADNLRREAIKRGIDTDRLVFAKRMPLAEHLSRHRLADLFLDTLPYNAHTTASDALWAGLPVLTLTGESFASRVAASLLNAIRLPELITSSEEEYEALAIELATNPEKLGEIRHKLEQNRLTTPLFDTPLFTRNLEELYRMMYERYQNEL